MTPSQASAQAIDRERTRLEERALRTARPVLLATQLEMTNALLGKGIHSPYDVAARMVINLTPPLGEELLGTALTARLRALTVAQAAIEDVQPSGSGGLIGRGGGGGGSRLLRGIGGPGGGRRPQSINELAQRFVNRRLNLNHEEVDRLTDGYGRTAARVAGDLGNRALQAAEKASAELVGKPLTTQSAVRIIRARLDAAGLTVRNPYAVETVYRTTVQTAYAAGRAQANDDPAVKEILWGYEFSAVMDDRTTEICQSLDGMRLPVDDPEWEGREPPCHFGCRSTRIEVFKGDKLAVATDVPDIRAMEGFGLNWGRIFAA